MKARMVGMVAAAALMVAGLLAAIAQPAAGFGSSSPQPGPPSVNAGGYMTCGIQPDLTAACWGNNVAEGPGQATPPAGVRFIEVNAGYNTACGVTVSRSIVCWGNNTGGKVTDVPSGTFLHVAPGFNFVCALRTDGHPVCWGLNDTGVVANTPTNEVFKELTVGIRHACGLRYDGTVVCWGSNTDRQQTDIPAGTFISINSGNFTICGIRPDLSVECWGRNQGGQLNEPPGPFIQVSVGFAHVCGLRPDRSITCWGRNAEGQTNAPSGQYTNVSAGTFHSCAMPVTGPPAVCWGNNAAGRVQPSLSPTAPPGGTVGTPYSHQLTMNTHLSPAPTFRVVSGTLPPGVSLTPQGLLAGTPTAPGTYEFTVSAANALSPPDCPFGATGSFPCTPGDPSSVATATRVYRIVVTEGTGAPTTTTPSPTTTTTVPSPTTTTTMPSPTTTTTLPGSGAQCQTLLAQRAAFNANLDALADQVADFPEVLASVEETRAEGNADYNRQLARAGCAV
ncbi:MAG TPA: hypothetical protein VGV86_16770 [Acidimicrobiales bacterium]|nr:hypothetical protein [Acidimicrobiales bacterium]